MTALGAELRAALPEIEELRALREQQAAMLEELRALRGAVARLEDRDGDNLLTLREAAEALRMSHGALKAAASTDPAFPRRGTGRAVRVRRGDLLAWHASRGGRGRRRA